MSSETNQDAGRSVLSWESVVDTDPTPDTPPAPTRTTPSPPPPAPAPVSEAAPEPQPAPLPAVELDIAPLSLTPIAPPPESPSPAVSEPPAPVLGAFHLDLNAISAPVEAVTPSNFAQVDAPSAPMAPVPPAPAVAPPAVAAAPAPVAPAPVAQAPAPEPVAPAPAPIARAATTDSHELKIAPLDMPDITPSGPVPAVEVEPVPELPVQQPTPASPESAAAPAPAPEPAGSTPAVPQPTPVAATPAPTPAPVEPAPKSATLPDDPVSADPTPTTVIAEVIAGEIAPPAVPGADAGADPVSNVAVVTVPEFQPSQANVPRVAPTAPRASAAPAAEPRNQKKQKKQKPKKQKKQKSGGGGIALFFTLLVLVGIIVGAIVFGRPYLFPDDWDVDAKPYGEAVEAVRGTDIAEPLLVNRTAGATYGVSLAEHLLGDWSADLPMWRSLALAKGPIDEPSLNELVANWTPAYYSAETSEVVANADLLPAAVDGAITEAMASAAIDQDNQLSNAADAASLDERALAEAATIAQSQRVSAATIFGAAQNLERRIDVAAFLPPVLEYRVNAPQAYAAFAESGALELSGTELLALSREPELADGDTIVSPQQQQDRTFWYMVFASYNSPVDAYEASNALVQSSLATADRAGVLCTYATFSGSGDAGAAKLADVLRTWASSAPVEMAASTSTLSDGALQLTSCDPGPGFESSARFGVAREIARWRSVELAALENVDPQTGTAADRAAAVQVARESQAALPMLEQPFDTPYTESARMARALVFTADGSLGTAVTADDPAGG